ncbi:hypothetical protein [uncultured Methylobacterium sp.]|jgi:hypothetical protein|uniref:hypothetical protein n=1 Tax=uncultured Methylobacterium sp. TaxID=157278 RepID=UPI002623A371|nr:hypothetical protein [uncultured Methylobacterium sp.]
MIWIAALAVFVAGAVGGLVNAFMTDNGFALPSSVELSGAKIWRPGLLGNAVVSAVAAVVSWGLYGVDANKNIFLASSLNFEPHIDLAALSGAVLVGIGGARWLTAEVDKKLLRGAAMAAASKEADTALTYKLAVSTPLQALKAATHP